MTYLLWTLQALLAALFLTAGTIKLAAPIDTLTDLVPLPGLLIRFVGVAEVLGGLGLILPSLLRIQPRLVVIAAVELAHIMVGAALVTIVIADPLSALMPVAVGGVALFIAYGRSRLAPQSAAHRRRASFQPAAVSS